MLVTCGVVRKLGYQVFFRQGWNRRAILPGANSLQVGHVLWQAISNMQEVFCLSSHVSWPEFKEGFQVWCIDLFTQLGPLSTHFLEVNPSSSLHKKKKNCLFHARYLPFWEFRCLLPSWTPKITQINISVLIIHIFKGAALKGNHLWFCIQLFFMCKNCHQNGFVAVQSFTEKLWLRTTANYSLSSSFSSSFGVI